MSAERTSYRPAKFLDNLEANKHTVMLYDNEKYADLIIARYFLNGLKKGESCIFFTSNDHDTIEDRLAEEGIDVKRYEKDGLLRIYHMKPPPPEAANKDPLTILKGIRADATKGMKPPYRFAGRTIRTSNPRKECCPASLSSGLASDTLRNLKTPRCASTTSQNSRRQEGMSGSPS